MLDKIYILGKSNYALSIIFDIIKLREWKVDLIIVQNIPDSENSSVQFPFENGITYREIALSDFKPSPTDEFIVGSIVT